jgi:hypothetical protein
VGNDDGGKTFSGDASAGLDAHIEENHVTVAIVTLACAGGSHGAARREIATTVGSGE